MHTNDRQRTHATDRTEKVTRERSDHPGIEPRETRRHPATRSRIAAGTRTTRALA